MAMSKKDFIEIADGCITAIKRGYVKKRDIEDFITVIGNSCNRCNPNFNKDTFRDYIYKGV